MSETIMCLMLAALRQGDLVSVLDAVAEDVNSRSQIAWIKTAEMSSLKPRYGREEIVAFFKELYPCDHFH
jgi:hypothetical protein